MHLIRFNPMRDLFSRRNRMSQIFNDFGFPTYGSDETMSVWNWKPLVDIYDNDENIVITAELPGINKEDIKVDVKDRVLTLKGERLSQNEVKEDSYHRRERVYGKFERAFTLSVEVDPEEIQADYKDGILKINIPKPKEQKPKQVTIH